MRRLILLLLGTWSFLLTIFVVMWVIYHPAAQLENINAPTSEAIQLKDNFELAQEFMSHKHIQGKVAYPGTFWIKEVVWDKELVVRLVLETRGDHNEQVELDARGCDAAIDLLKKWRVVGGDELGFHNPTLKYPNYEQNCGGALQYANLSERTFKLGKSYYREAYIPGGTYIPLR